MLLRTSELTAFYAGSTGLGLAAPADEAAAKAKRQDKGQIVRLEAKRDVLLTSKDGQTAGAKAAIFDVKANTVLLVGDVLVTKSANDPKNPQKTNVLEAPRLKIDLTTGIYLMESGPSNAARPVTSPPQQSKGAATSSSPPATSGYATNAEGRPCKPGTACALIYPNLLKEEILKNKKKKAPGANAR
jgi:hypothetical protein